MLTLGPAIASLDSSFVADVHLPLLGGAASAAIAANAFLSTRMANEVDLNSTAMPHVTLYLTEWMCDPQEHACKDPVNDALSGAVYGLATHTCSVEVGAPYAAGQFAMLNVTLTECIQFASDSIVNETFALAVPNQSVPSWVDSLPEPERSEKIADVKKYGSPNVFDQFQPHVTIGWASNASAVEAAIAALTFEPVTFSADVVALGTTGDHGTVLRGQDLARFNLSDLRGGCHYPTPTACDADNVTRGGCIWCDVVDRKPFCTTRVDARSHHHPPEPPFMCDWAYVRV